MRALLVLLLVTATLAGCVSDDPATQSAPDRGPADLAVQVPVPVILVGFPDAVVRDVARALVPMPVDQQTGDFDRNFPPNGELFFSGDSYPLPLDLSAHYDVIDGTPVLGAGLDDLAAGGNTTLDGNAFEDWAWEAMVEADFPVSERTPGLLFIHIDRAHSWRYTYANGALEPVRVFGERYPFVVLDVSAADDPYGAELSPYDDVIADAGAAAGALVAAAKDATNFRLMQGPVYPVSLAPCHAVTLVLAIRVAAVPEGMLGNGLEDPASYLGTERLHRAFVNLTGDEVFVDPVVIQLPHEDPALEALTRGSIATLDALRWHLDENWDQYWVAHEGCEPYISIVVLGDAGDDGSGIALYDVQTSHRISVGSDNQVFRTMQELEMPLPQVLRGTGSTEYDWANLLFSHETGHLFGQMHPQHLLHADGFRQNDSWNSVWSTMAYQSNDMNLDFGKIDHNNFLRNRVEQAIAVAMESGLEGTPEWHAALHAADDLDWIKAYDTLYPVIQG